MILSGRAIQDQIQAERINITPFDASQLNPNSYNLTLGPALGVYTEPGWDPGRHFSPTMSFPMVSLDCRREPSMFQFEIPEAGMVLYPGKLYLGATVEMAGTDYYVPMIEGRSSLARLGLSIHQTGGFGDVGFHGQWTLEFTCVEPIRIYAGMQIAQVQFWEITGPITLYNGKYTGQRGPIPSRLHKEMTRV